MIDGMFQEATDAALDDQVRRPRSVALKPPGAFEGFTTAVPRGVGGGVAKSIAFGAELVGAFGQVAGAYPEMFGGPLSDQQHKEADAARTNLLKPGGGVDYSNEAGDIFRTRAKDILPDPQTAGAATQVAAGFADFATRAFGYAYTLGPLAPLTMGGDTGLEEADRLKQQGVDIGTRTKAGAVAGVLNAAAVALPMTGATATTRFVKGVAIGESTIVGQSLAEQHILRAAGYDKIADTFDPLDPVALAMGVVPGALGAKFGKPKLRTEADVKKAAAFTPEEQARSDAYERSPTNLAELERAIKAEKRPEVRALLETERAKQSKLQAEHGVEAAVRAEPALEPAVRVAQVVDALDNTRLTPDADLVGRDQHLSAVELASDQLGRGEAVEVAHLLSPDDSRMQAAVDSMRGPLEPVLRPDDPHLSRLGDLAARDKLGELYSRAARDKPAFDSALQRIADESGARVKLASLKGAGRAVDKVLADYGGDVSKIKDILRATVEVSSPEQARQVIAALHEQFAVHEHGKRNLLDPSARPIDGYRDAKLNVDMGGHTAEIQVHLPQMLAVKKEVHALYARREKLTREAVARGDLTQPPEVAQLNAKMRAAYDAAWAEATNLRKPDSSTGLPLRRADSGSKGRGEDLSQARDSEGGTPAPMDTGIPSTSKNSTPSGNLAGKDGFISTSERSLTQSVANAADKVATLDPDMLVHMDGMEAPMRVGDLLAKVREEAAQDVKSAKLLEVAAACDLSS